MVRKFDESMNNDLNEPLVKLCAITQKYYWERLVNTNSDRRFFSFELQWCSLKKWIINFLLIFLKGIINTIFLLRWIICMSIMDSHYLISKCIVQIWLQIMVPLIVIRKFIATMKLHFTNTIIKMTKTTKNKK